MRVISHNISDLYDKNDNSPETPEKVRASKRNIDKRKSLEQMEMLNRIDKALRDRN